MPNPINNLSKEEMRDMLNDVLYAAVASQYFEESHKHRAHLYDITERIDPRMAKLCARNPGKAFKKAAKRAGAY